MASFFNNTDFLAELKDAVETRERELYMNSLVRIRDVIVDDIERHILYWYDDLQTKLLNAVRSAYRCSDYKIDVMSYSVRHWTRTLKEREEQLERARANGTEAEFFKEENDNLNFLCTSFYIPHNYNGIRRTEVLNKTDALLILSARFGPHFWFSHRVGNVQMRANSFVVMEEHVVMHYYPNGISKDKRDKIASLSLRDEEFHSVVEPATPPCEKNELTEPPALVRNSSWPWRCHDSGDDCEPYRPTSPVENC